MRLSDLVTELQVTLDSKSNRKWTEADLGMALNSKQRAMVRKMVELDEAFFNHTFVLAKPAARQPHANMWTWKLPLWVLKVTSVRQYHGAGASYGRGPRIGRATKYDQVGWMFSAANELRLIGYSAAIDLEIECAKIPARMTKGTLPSQAGVTSVQMKLPADPAAAPTVHVHDTVVDAYAGALFEITGPASTRVGQLLRCIASTADPAGRLLTMEEAWTSVPLVSDTYEMHMEVPMQHSRLLVLLAARQLFSQEKNLDAVAAIRDEVQEEWQVFLQTMGDRDLTEPHTVIESMPTIDGFQDPYLQEYLI